MEPTSGLTRRAPGLRPRPAAAPQPVRRNAQDLRALAAQVCAALVLSAAGGLIIAVTGEWQIAVGLLLAASFVALGLLQPAVFVAALILLRPLLDGIPLGAGAALGVVLIGVCALVLVSAPRIVRPRATIAFSALLLISALASLSAFLEYRDAIGSRPVTELVRLTALFAMYLLAAQVVTSTAAVRRVFLFVGLSGVLPALSAIKELLSSPEEIASLGLVRVSGTFVNPVSLSSYLALSVLILLSLPREDVARRVRWPAIGLMSIALVASYGREGWALLLLAIVLLHWRKRKRYIAGVAVACTLLLMFVPSVHDRVLPSAEATGSEATSTFASYDWRLANWRGLLERYADRPLTGWGLTTTPLVNPRRLVGLTHLRDGGFQAHNAAVRALVEGGPLLLGAVLALFAALISSLWRIAAVPDSPLVPYARLLAAAWLAMLIVALTTNDLLDATSLVYALLAMSGALEGAHRRLKSKQASARGPSAAAFGTGR